MSDYREPMHPVEKASPEGTDGLVLHCMSFSTSGLNGVLFASSS